MNSYETLAQIETTTADTDYSMYTVPALTQVVVSNLRISAKTLNSKFRVSIVPSGDTLAGKHVIHHDELIEPGRGRDVLKGYTLAAGSQIVVRANTGSSNLSFSLFGSKIT